MSDAIEIENIEDLRRARGIDDLELRREVRALRAGDHVRVTLLPGNGPFGGETVLVRLTRVRGVAFRGKLARQPSCRLLAGLRVGSPLVFTRDYIHSIPRPRPPADGPARPARSPKGGR